MVKMLPRRIPGFTTPHSMLIFAHEPGSMTNRPLQVYSHSGKPLGLDFRHPSIPYAIVTAALCQQALSTQCERTARASPPRFLGSTVEHLHMLI